MSYVSTLLAASARVSLITAFSLAGLNSAMSAPQPEQPNIIVMMADDMGYGDLSTYGHPNIVTPNLDAMATEGIKLTSFYAGQAVCTPSRAALMTGRYAIRSGMQQVLMPDSDRGLPQSEFTMAEMLKSQGYQTAMVGKWHLGDKAGFLPVDHGFDQYFGLLYSNDMTDPWVTAELMGRESMSPLQMFRNDKPVGVIKDQSVLTTSYTEEAVANIGAFSDDKPFFLYMAWSMPHLPVAAPDFQKGKSAGGLYGDAVSTIDWSVGEVMNALEEKGVADNTIIVFFSDNGPWQNLPDRMVQGGVERWHVGSAGTLKGSKGTTYEGGSRVPAIIHWPDSKINGSVNSELISALDLFPTFATLSGATLPEDLTLDGADLSDFLKGNTPHSKDNYFYYFRGDVAEAVRDKKWKLRLSPFDEFSGEMASAGATRVQAELYNLEDDPSERFNVADSHPDVVDRLTKQLARFAEETESQTFAGK